MTYMQDRIATLELEVFVGHDRIVRINVDGQCSLRVRMKPGTAFRVTGAVQLVEIEQVPIS